jgi:cation diffusion facilitator CzcD-associated flavoprotein CzcO
VGRGECLQGDKLDTIIYITRRDNKFPGCCCDVFSVLYSYSFAQNPTWSRRYPGQEEILVSCLAGVMDLILTGRQDYLTDVAQKYGLYKYARFHSAVEEAHWNDKTLKWEVAVSVGGGKESEFTSAYKITTDFLVAATGQLNKPKGINVPGYHDYQGKIMHSARWDWSYDMRGKRIAIIGTGKSIEIAKCFSNLG